jgi:hypothetical protein
MTSTALSRGSALGFIIFGTLLQAIATLQRRK